MEGENFEPIGFLPGFASGVFTGEFDGNGKVIKNGNINYPDLNDYHIGLFALNRGIIKNVGMVNVNVIGGGAVGGLVGSNEGEISKSYVIGNNNNPSWVGDVNARLSAVGGLVGTNRGRITESYATANIISYGWSGQGGGLAGINFESGEIINSYATGNVDAYELSGGLAGRNQGAITNSYSIGKVEGGFKTDIPRKGGLIGHTWTGGSTDNSFWNTQTSGLDISSGGEGRTTDQMQNATATSEYDGHQYTGWDNEIWIFTSNQYPKLYWE